MTFLLFGCSNPEQNLIVVENDYEIDLSNIDSVRENLNGYWLLDYENRDLNKEMIIDLQFVNDKSIWNTTTYTKTSLGNSIGNSTCSPVACLISINDTIHIKFVSMGGADTNNIDYLSKTKLVVNGITYLKHKGYDEDEFFGQNKKDESNK